jgi:carboxypeptidase D
MIKITDDPDREEDEPEISIIGGIHGDEPVGVHLAVELARDLVHGHGVEPEVTARVNAAEIWILPLFNPDGYAVSERFNAAGADLNRSFPDRVLDSVYTPAGRPPEVAALMEWAASTSPVLSVSLHGGALVVSYPFDGAPDPAADYAAAPDDALFIELSHAYASNNPALRDNLFFPDGIVNGAAWYHLHGGMQDWLYIHHGCFAVTAEISDPKIPPAAALPDYWASNRPALYAYMDWAEKGVRGVVTDAETGVPLPGTVRIRGIDRPVFTDPDAGDYHRLLTPGVYTVEIDSAGYEGIVFTGVAVTEGPATRLDAALFPAEDSPGNPGVDDPLQNGPDNDGPDNDGPDNNGSDGEEPDAEGPGVDEPATATGGGGGCFLDVLF